MNYEMEISIKIKLMELIDARNKCVYIKSIDIKLNLNFIKIL